MSILVTGFAPFDGESINPAWQAAQALPDTIAGLPVYKRELPTSFANGPRVLLAALEEYRPQVALCLGQAGGRAQLSLEKVAINYCHARIPDNDGAAPQDSPLCPGGPDAYLAPWPVHRLAAALNERGIPAAVSYTAGTYVCNAVFYTLLRAASARPGLCGGFVHLPYLPQQAAGKAANTPSLELARDVEGIKLLLELLAGGDADKLG